MKRKILFLGETYRADAITWMNGLKEYGDFEIFTWELSQTGTGLKKVKRAMETISRLKELKQQIAIIRPDLIIAERVTSYGFIAALFHTRAPVVIAQQGITDIFPRIGMLVPFKKTMQRYAFKKAKMVHAWGQVMTPSMLRRGTPKYKIMVLAKGVDLRSYQFQPAFTGKKIKAIVTRSLGPDYRHETILSAFELIKQQHIPFELVIVGDGPLKEKLMQSAIDKNIQEEVVFAGRIDNAGLPGYLGSSDLYISMPCSEGVSASLFEAMAAGCYPIVSALPGNKAWIKDRINGRLVPVDDVQQLAAAIKDYATNRDQLEDALFTNRKTVEQQASYQRNMTIICAKYHQIINGLT